MELKKFLRNLTVLICCFLLAFGNADAAQLSRLHSAEIQNGNLVNADDLNAEIDQQLTESNSQDTRITTIESGSPTISGNKTFSGTTTFSGPTVFSSSSNTFSGTSLFTGIANLARATDPSGTAGNIWYNSASTDGDLRAYVGSATGVIPVGLKIASGPPPTFTSVSSVTVPSGLTVVDATGVSVMKVASDIVVSLASSGAAGLDTGSEASNTWYYIWVCKGSSGVTAIFSTSSSSPTLPTGYNTYKKLLPIAVRNDGSSNIINFTIGEGWPYRPRIQYNVYLPGNTTSSTTSVLATSASASFTDLSLASFVPPISKMAWLSAVLQSGTLSEAYVRQKGVSHNGTSLSNAASTVYVKELFPMETDASQVVQYSQTAAGNFYVHVAGFVVTEVP